MYLLVTWYKVITTLLPNHLISSVLKSSFSWAIDIAIAMTLFPHLLVTFQIHMIMVTPPQNITSHCTNAQSHIQFISFNAQVSQTIPFYINVGQVSKNCSELECLYFPFWNTFSGFWLIKSSLISLTIYWHYNWIMLETSYLCYWLMYVKTTDLYWFIRILNWKFCHIGALPRFCLLQIAVGQCFN